MSDGDEAHGTPLMKRHSLDPKCIIALESTIMNVMKGLNDENHDLMNKTKSKSATTSMKNAQFSMEQYESDNVIITTLDSNDKTEQKPKPPQKASHRCCVRSPQVQPRRSCATSEYSLKNHCNELLPPQSSSDKGKISLVLDIDETLLHSSFIPIENPDFEFQLEEGADSISVQVLVRPGAIELIEKAGPLFELIIFTASNRPYADFVVNKIDSHKLIKHRLYRESCVDLNGCTVKDLSLLNRDLKRIIIVDNSAMASLLQPYNSIVVESWYDNKKDKELFRITDFLLQHYKDADVYEFLVNEKQEDNKKA